MWFRLLLYVVLLCLLTLIIAEFRNIQRFSNTTYRFGEPISGSDAFSKRQDAIVNDEALPTFWSEHSVTVATISDVSVHLNNTVHTPAISFSGDAFDVWPADFIYGGTPGSIDQYGIALSEALAFQLFGSTDILGQTITVNGDRRIIRGVFEGSANLSLISYHIEYTGRSWDFAEMARIQRFHVMPIRWSDFNHWVNLISQVQHELHLFVSVTPTLREVQQRMHMLNFTGLLFTSMMVSFMIVVSNKQRTSSSRMINQQS